MSLLVVTLLQGPPLMPISGAQWQVEALQDGCRVSRTFGDGNKSVTLALAPQVHENGGEMAVVVHAGNWPASKRQGEGTIEAPNGEVAAKIRWASEQISGDRSRIDMKVGRLVWPWLNRVNSMIFRFDNGRVVPLRFDSDHPAAPIRRCADDLFQKWGADPADVVRASPNQYSVWFPANSYPIEARRARQEGRVGILVSFDDRGQPVRCKTIVSSRAEPLDRGTCMIAMSNARLTLNTNPASKTRHVYAAIDWALR